MSSYKSLLLIALISSVLAAPLVNRFANDGVKASYFDDENPRNSIETRDEDMAEGLGNPQTRGNEVNHAFAGLETRDGQDSRHQSDDVYARDLDNLEDSADLLTRDLGLNDESLGEGFGNILLARDKKTGSTKTSSTKTGGVAREKKEIKDIQDEQRAQKKKANAMEDRERAEISEAREKQKKGTTATEKQAARKKKINEQNELNDVKKANSKEKAILQKEKEKEKAELAEEKKKEQQSRKGGPKA
ncbi:hypothetical protein CSHISOI_11032 [Colletotrichum shisoi]|uniref:Stress response protein nst1 n=1 Tax=Colletotrichum shisoi TaxID=2078593 RepID=A0A5Q4BCE6_9PEZI|nr:hypothetical protein CSHISOI_11032 [Colletotrichum shisoi]